MNNRLLKEIIHMDGFIEEETVVVDENLEVLIRPLYIELIYLYPDLMCRLVEDIANSFNKKNVEVIYAIEAAILPLASQIASRLNCPLAIIRKPRNFHHEEKEPCVFIKDDLKGKRSILIDDAIWSGYTMHSILDLLDQEGIEINYYYFIIDFMDFSGGQYLSESDYQKIKDYQYWIQYQKIVEAAFKEGIITDITYKKTMKLFH